MKFNHKEIEKKWQEFWDQQKVYKTNFASDKKTYYALDMFPYPSGSGLHVGHPEGYTATDIMSRYKRAKGFEVLHPMGWDAFGLPAEQYAVQTGNSPAEFTNTNIKTFRKQLDSLGFSFDWSREVTTTDPEYFKWTQWIFAQLYKKGLAELKPVEVNWCAELNTVLANEETYEDDNGNLLSERGDFSVEKKEMNQWVLKITKYADKLFEGLENLDWPESLKNLQKNWIYNREEKTGKKELHLRDWLFSRQRYWGEPFPIIHGDDGEIKLIPEKQYPITLPEITDYKFSKDGKPALAKNVEWAKTSEGVRDLNTMPQWAGSCWYFLGYILKQEDGTYLPLDSSEAKERLNRWMPVDLYVGGQEHAVLHLIYARFWTIFLSEIGILDKGEPFQKLFNQGMIQGEDGSKMSKSKGNVVNPDDIVKEFGADALRIYLMFMGPLDQDKPWTTKGIKASRDWLDRVYRFYTEVKVNGEPSIELKRAYNKMLAGVEKDIENLRYNIAISKMQVFINLAMKDSTMNMQMQIEFLIILSTFAPHIAEELYQTTKRTRDLKSISQLSWPSKLEVSEAEFKQIVIIQVNGKVRAKVEDADLGNSPTEEELKLFAQKYARVNISEIKKVIFINKKILSVVI